MFQTASSLGEEVQGFDAAGCTPRAEQEVKERGKRAVIFFFLFLFFFISFFFFLFFFFYFLFYFLFLFKCLKDYPLYLIRALA